MWRVFHTNNICYLKDFKKEQASFKNRLNKIKPVLKIIPPYKSINNIKGYSFDKYKINYDNKILKKKKREINNSKGNYNQELLRPNSVFSGFRNSNFDKYLELGRRTVHEDNMKLKKRIRSAKPVYSVEKMKKDAKENQKYREFMLEVLRKNRVSPLYNDEMENILNV